MSVTALQISTGHSCVVDIDEHDTVLTLKRRICGELFAEEVTDDEISLELHGTALDDDLLPISCCELEAGSTLHVLQAVSNKNRLLAESLLEAVKTTRDTYTLPDGTTMDVIELLKYIIHLNPMSHYAYSQLAFQCYTSKSTTFADGTTLSDKDLYIESLRIQETGIAYDNLGLLLEDDETVLLYDGSNCSAKDLFKRAIAADPFDHNAYEHLAYCLKDDEEEELENGEAVSSKHLYRKAVSLHPTDVYAYRNLACCLKEDEYITLLDGSYVNDRLLFKKAISLQPEEACLYYNLANVITHDEVIHLEDGTPMTQTKLYVKALSLSPSLNAHNNLAICLSKKGKGQTIALSEGIVLSEEDLYKRAISQNPSCAFALSNLALCLEDGETTVLEDQTVVRREDLHIRGIRLDPEYGGAYGGLAMCLLSGDSSISVSPGKEFTKKELLKTCLALSSFEDSAWELHELGASYPLNEEIDLGEEGKVTRRELFMKASDVEWARWTKSRCLLETVPHFCVKAKRRASLPELLISYFKAMVYSP